MTQRLTDEQTAAFHRDGFVIAKAFFDADEMHILRSYAKADKALQQAAFQRADTQGGAAKMTLWNEAGDDLYGIVARTAKLVDASEQLLGAEVYNWHQKMSMKEPFTGGAWEWHQDYGYWYKNGCLFPDLLSAFIAVDPNTRENGCMQVIKGSHLIGRVEHGKFGDQVGADPERVEAALARLELVYCILEPGDTLFFHSNLLHRSDQNQSPDARWSLICCYNTRYNDPFKQSNHPNYTPLKRVSDDTIKQAGPQLLASLT
jgi:ectoine hydroxylase-related dioxygenase (phytanoyl-CoA dioxygenase family)